MKQNRKIYSAKPILINIAYLDNFSPNFPTKRASFVKPGSQELT